MGGLYTSNDDLARYLAFMLSAWPPRDEAEAVPCVVKLVAGGENAGQRPFRLAVFRTAPDAPLPAQQPYAYGLGSTQTCRFSA